jgi:hypothetical protein
MEKLPVAIKVARAVFLLERVRIAAECGRINGIVFEGKGVSYLK